MRRINMLQSTEDFDSQVYVHDGLSFKQSKESAYVI